MTTELWWEPQEQAIESWNYDPNTQNWFGRFAVPVEGEVSIAIGFLILPGPPHHHLHFATNYGICPVPLGCFLTCEQAVGWAKNWVDWYNNQENQ